jgi:hypothetical protein
MQPFQGSNFCLPDWSIISVDECLGWLQDSVYQGYAVRVQEGWATGTRSSFSARDQALHLIASNISSDFSLSEG